MASFYPSAIWITITRGCQNRRWKIPWLHFNHRCARSGFVWTETVLKKSRKGARKPKKAVDESQQEVRGPENWSVATGVRDSGGGRTYYAGDRGTKSAQAWIQSNVMVWVSPCPFGLFYPVYLFYFCFKKSFGSLVFKIGVTTLPLSNSVAPGGITWAGVRVLCLEKGFLMGGGGGCLSQCWPAWPVRQLSGWWTEWTWVGSAPVRLTSPPAESDTTAVNQRQTGRF